MSVQRYAVAQGDVIINAIMADANEYTPPEGQELILSEGGGPEIGWIRSGKTWVDPTPEAEPAPVTQVTQRQARLALLGAGLLSQVEAALDSMPEPQRAAAKIEWEYALFIDRNSQLTQGLAAALGLSEQDMDALFAQAATL